MPEMTRFGPLDIRFDDSVLRPRQWTIAQSKWAAELSGTVPEGVVLELCAGAGHIGLALASLVSRSVVLVDVDAAACSFARTNAVAAGIAGRVDVRIGLMEAVLSSEERFALILADPPWVRSNETARFPSDPLLAIDGGPDGLDLARICVDLIGRHLAAAGAAILQLGDIDQGSEMSAYLEARPQIGLRIDEIRTYSEGGILMHLARKEGVAAV